MTRLAAYTSLFLVDPLETSCHLLFSILFRMKHLKSLIYINMVLQISTEIYIDLLFLYINSLLTRRARI